MIALDDVDDELPDEIGVALTVVGAPLAMLWERQGRVVRWVLVPR